MKATLLLGGLLVLCACSGSGGNVDAGPPALEFNDFCTKYLEAAGAQLSTCQSGPKELWVGTLKQYLVCDDLKKAVTAGRAAYDGTTAQQCLTAVAAISCTTLTAGLSEPPAYCVVTLTGKVKVGEKCYGAGPDCGENGFCAKASGACDGTCKARIAAGAACAIGDDCIKGYSCVNSVCTIDPPAGVDVGASCTGSSKCKPGLVCDSVTKNCANYIKEGQACVFGHNTCENFTSCGSNNTCVRSAMPGGACGTTVMGTLYEYAGCVGSYCKIPMGMSTGTCTLRGATDAMCANGDECTSGKCVSGKCAAPCVVP